MIRRHTIGESNVGDIRIDPSVHIRIYAIVVSCEESTPQTDLFRIAKIFGLLGAIQHRGKHGQSEAGQNRDDRDHDEQFDKGKCRRGFFNHRGYLLVRSLDAFEGRANFIFTYFLEG